MTTPPPCWIVLEPDDGRWLADRTARALRERGIAAQVATSSELAAWIDTTRAAWLLRAGATPDRLPALPPPLPGRPATSYLGVEHDDEGRIAPGWQTLVDAHGGHVAPGTVLPRWVVARIEAPGALADALRGGATTMQQALAALCASGRGVVATGIRARWSADVRVALLVGMLHRGGAERVVLDLAAHLPAQGVATRVFTAFPPKRDTLAAPVGTVHVHEPAAGAGDLAARADRALCRWGADVVHAHLMDGRLLRGLTALGHGVATTLHNARVGWPAHHEAPSRDDMELAIGCSLSVARELREATAASARPVAVRTAWNGIAPVPAPAPVTRVGARRELGIADDALVIVSVANDRPQKRLHLLAPLLDALDALSPGAACIQVGARPDARLPETARSLPAAPHPRLHFVGARGDVARWLAAADVFVSTSAHEGLSLAQLEALAAGLPVVATAAGGHEELQRMSDAYVALPLDTDAPTFARAVVAAAASRRGTRVEAMTARRMAERHATLYRATVAARHARRDGVIVVSNNYQVGGAQSSARRFALALHAQGRRCAAAVLFETRGALSPGSQAIADAGVDVFAPTPAQRTDARALADAVVDFVHRFGPAAVIFWNANVELKIGIADRLLAVPVFDTSPGEMYFAEFDRWLAKPPRDLPVLHTRDYGALLAGAVVKYGDERERAERALGRPVSVVPNGLPIPPCAQQAPGARGAIVGTLARLNPDKKLEQLIAAFELASARVPELQLLVGGAPDKGHEDYADALRRGTAHLRIRWLGHVEPAALFDRVALLAMISEPAGCPNASLEAMAAGLPVLATRWGGIAEQVVDGHTGWLVPRGDAAALADRLVAALSDPATLSACGTRGRERAIAHFSVERMVDGYLQAMGLTDAPSAADTR